MTVAWPIVCVCIISLTFAIMGLVFPYKIPGSLKIEDLDPDLEPEQKIMIAKYYIVIARVWGGLSLLAFLFIMYKLIHG